MTPTMLNRAARTGALTRAPQVATLTAQEHGIGSFSFGANALLQGDKAWREAYYANIWVYRCAQVIAEDLATLPIRVGKDPQQPGEYDLTHPLAVLLGPPPGTPNPTTSARNLWLWTVVQKIITGAFAWEIEKGPDSGLPMFLWPIPTNRVKPIPSKGGNAYFTGYEVSVGKGKARTLSADRMVYDWRPSAEDWRQPESVLRAAKLDISVAVMQDRYDFAFLKNDARPATIVVHEAFQSVDERDAWRQSFVSTHGGPDNAGKVAFAETSIGGAKPSESMLVQTLGMSSKDAQMVQRYETKLRAIEVAFGVPRSRLGDASARTFANASEEWKGYWQTTIKHLALELADAINTHLAPKFGMDVCWFDFSANPLLRDEPPFAVEEAMPLYRGGVVSLNEVRTKVLYLPAVEGGDELVVQEIVKPGASEVPGSSNATPLPDVPEPVEVPDAGEAKSAQSPPAVSPASVLRLHARAAARAAQRAQRDAEQDAPTREDRVRELYRIIDNDLDSLERRWTRRWERHFDAQLTSILARLEGKRGRQLVRVDPTAVDPIFDPVFWQRTTEEEAVEMFTDTVDAAVRSYSSKFGISLDVDAVWARQFIGMRANQLAGQVTQTTYNAIKKQLATGASEGESIPELAKRIENLFQQTYKNRATVVARTEVISGYNGGTDLAITNTPREISAGKEWISSIDDRTRDWHIPPDGQIVAVGQSFTVNAESLQYPGDPSGSSENVIMCRCTVAPVAPEDMPKAN